MEIKVITLLFLFLISHTLCSLTQAEKGIANCMEKLIVDAILQSHNEARRNVHPPAKEMPDLIWDNALEQIAQNWAAECKSSNGKIINHNPNRGANVGENIAAYSGDRPSMSYLVELWVNEKKDYDYASNTCAPDRVCGHYTQVVWAKTTKVGCGFAVCDKLEYKQTLVCNYSPAGNKLGEKPYEEGVAPKVSPKLSSDLPPQDSSNGPQRITFNFLILLILILINF